MVPFGQSAAIAAATVCICLLVLVYVRRDRWPLYRLLAGRKTCIISILTVLFLLLIFGLVPQDGGRNGLSGVLGFRSMNRSPIFILALLMLAVTVSLNAIENIHHFSRHRLGVTCAHLGLSVILVLGVFGGGGTVRADLEARPGVPVHTAFDERGGGVRKLPFELILKSFDINEYASEVRVTFPDGSFYEASVAVNHPSKIGSWRIYQTDFRMDASAGEFTCMFKCVHSPFSGIFKAALWLILSAAVAMAFFAGYKPRTGGCIFKRKEA